MIAQSTELEVLITKGVEVYKSQEFEKSKSLVYTKRISRVKTLNSIAM
jgi:hypothetical protein